MTLSLPAFPFQLAKVKNAKATTAVEALDRKFVSIHGAGKAGLTPSTPKAKTPTPIQPIRSEQRPSVSTRDIEDMATNLDEAFSKGGATRQGGSDAEKRKEES